MNDWEAERLRCAVKATIEYADAELKGGLPRAGRLRWRRTRERGGGFDFYLTTASRSDGSEEMLLRLTIFDSQPLVDLPPEPEAQS